MDNGCQQLISNNSGFEQWASYMLSSTYCSLKGALLINTDPSVHVLLGCKNETDVGQGYYQTSAGFFSCPFCPKQRENWQKLARNGLFLCAKASCAKLWWYSRLTMGVTIAPTVRARTVCLSPRASTVLRWLQKSHPWANSQFLLEHCFR